MRRLPLGARLLILPLILVACANGDRPGDDGPGRTGLRGVVTVGPTCPVATLEDPCDARILPDTPVQVLRGDEEVATVTSDGQGRFRIELAPGEYTLLALPEDGARFAKPVTVSVPSVGFADVVVAVDSGIRGPSEATG